MKSIAKSGLIYLFNIIIFLAGQTACAEPSPQDILAKSDASRGNQDGIQWTITIDSIEAGRSQNRTLSLKAKDLNSLAEFKTPAKVKGQKILMQDRNMWFIKPGLRKPVPLSPRQKLMGGASYGDIASTNYSGDYTIAQSTTGHFNGEDCYIFDLAAKDRKTTYDKIRYWISKSRGTGMKAIFYTVSGKPFKSAVFEYDNQIDLEGRAIPFVSRMTIQDAVITSNVTTLVYTDIYVKPVPDSTFNLNLLVR